MTQQLTAIIEKEEDGYTSRVQEYPVQGAWVFADSCVVKTCHSPTMPAFLRLAIDENPRTLNGVFLNARGIF